MMLQEETADYSGEKINQRVCSFNVSTVEEIEQWLKLTSEPILNSGLNKRKNSLSNVERYLREQSVDIFYEEDSLISDSDLILNTLDVDYDIFNKIQNEKILSICDKYNDFIPELQLENVDNLTSFTDDLILEKENSLEKSQILCTNNNNISTFTALDKINYNDKVFINTQVQDVVNNILNEQQLECNTIASEHCLNDSSSGLVPSIQDSYTDDSNSCTNFQNNNVNNHAVSENVTDQSYVQTKPKNSTCIKLKIKLLNGKDTYYCDNNNVTPTTNISKCKHSNVILPSNKRKINSETSKKNFSKRSRENRRKENSDVKPLVYYSKQDEIISKALFELNITDKTLQYIRTEDNVKIWKCHQAGCKRQFPKLCHLKAHLLTHFGVKPFKCEHRDCTWAFSTELKLKRHQKTHTLKKEHTCPAPGCKRQFTTIRNLALHEKLHGRPNVLSCRAPECETKFPTQRELDRHMKNQHDLAVYVCSHEGCGKRYFRASEFGSHQRSHSHAIEELRCGWPGCGKTYHHPSQLKVHTRTHTGSKPYACDFRGCEWAFATSRARERHRRSHTNQREFVCELPGCGKAFLRSEHLKEHKLTHSEGRLTFSCYFCNTVFVSKGSLYNHIKKHLNGDFEKGQAKRETAKRAKTDKKMKGDSKVQPVKKTINQLKNNSSSDKGLDTEQKPVNQENQIFINTNKSIDAKPSNINLKNKNSRFSLRLQSQKENIAPLSEIQNHNSFTSSPLSQEEHVTYSSLEHSATKLQVSLSTKPLVVEQLVSKNAGSARTAFTYEDVLNLKPNKSVVDSNVEASNAVLGVECGLLSEDLPSMLCQEDIQVP